MAEAHERTKIVYQNLLDAGCDASTTRRCIQLLQEGKASDLLPILSAHRKTLLAQLRREQKQIDCLDYLVYRIQKKECCIMKTTMPKLALGAWSWGAGAAGGDQVFGNRLFEAELQPVFAQAMACGLTLWDTAAVYGEGSSERILGHFVESVPRESLILSTKFTPQIANGTESAMQDMLNESKARLHTDVIDVYWVHNPMDVEKWTPQLIPLLQSGQVKSVGVSNHNLAQIKRANEILSAAGFRVSAVQNHYSLLHRSSERAGILDYCKENGITFYAYMVLEQGALSGKYDTAHPFPAGSGRGNSYNPHLTEIETLVSALREIGAAHNASPAQVATAWAIAKGTLPIIGVTKPQQVEEAAAAASIRLTEEEVRRLEQLGDETGVHTLREWEQDMD